MSNPKPFPFNRNLQPRQSPPGLADRAGELRAALQQLPAELLAARTGSVFSHTTPGRGEFRLSLFDSVILGSFPNFIFTTLAGEELPSIKQLMLLYYFHTASGVSLTEKWVSFADLPGGRMYSQAYQGYTGDELVKQFGLSLEKFQAACQKLGGAPAPMADAAYSFQCLPRVPVLVTYWQGDEDFSSTSKTLFDASATEYLPIDGCAILGSMLAGKIIRAGNT